MLRVCRCRRHLRCISRKLEPEDPLAGSIPTVYLWRSKSPAARSLQCQAGKVLAWPRRIERRSRHVTRRVDSHSDRHSHRTLNRVSRCARYVGYNLIDDGAPRKADCRWLRLQLCWLRPPGLRRCGPRACWRYSRRARQLRATLEQSRTCQNTQQCNSYCDRRQVAPRRAQFWRRADSDLFSGRRRGTMDNRWNRLQPSLYVRDCPPAIRVAPQAVAGNVEKGLGQRLRQCRFVVFRPFPGRQPLR